MTHCQKFGDVLEEAAIQDYQLGRDNRVGLMPCFCMNKYQEAKDSGFSIQESLDFELSDGKRHCKDWLSNYNQSFVLVYGVPLIIVFINWVSKTILRIMTRFEKNQNKPREVYASAINMFMLQFINSGIIILLVNFRLTDKTFTSWFPIPILEGKYQKFTADWYTEIAPTICITLILMCLSPHGANLTVQLLYATRRCYDRRFTLNSKKTRQILQQDYESLNVGNEFMMEFRYANMLGILSVTFFYSSGIPLLYPIACLFFIVTYWIDKFLLFRCYK